VVSYVPISKPTSREEERSLNYSLMKTIRRKDNKEWMEGYNGALFGSLVPELFTDDFDLVKYYAEDQCIDITDYEVVNVEVIETKDKGNTSDGFHTFSELYEHRIVIYMALCNSIKDKYSVWKSKTHSDGSSSEGWFVLGINKESGKQITYHLPISKWDDCNFEELEKCPDFDGHDSKEVLNRISKL